MSEREGEQARPYPLSTGKRPLWARQVDIVCEMARVGNGSWWGKLTVCGRKALQPQLSENAK